MLFKLNRFEKKDYIAIFAIIIFFIVNIFIINLKINGFLLRSGDTIVAEQAIWNFTHGYGFQQGSLLDESNMREHLNFVQFVYIPFYKIFPNLVTVYAVIILFYCAGALALFQYAKSKVGKTYSLILLLAYLFNPEVLISNIDTMHVVSIAGPLMLFLLICYEKGKYRWWLFWLFITASVSEFVYPTILMLSFLSLVQKRSIKWVFPPIIASSLMFFAANYYITLGYAKTGRIADFFKNGDFFSRFNSRRFSILENLLRPVFYITPVFSWYILLILPTFFIIFFAIENSRIKASQHLYVFVPTILFFSIIDFAGRINEEKRKILMILVIIGTFLSIFISYGFWNISPNKYSKEMKEVSLLIPENVSVSASRIVGTHLNHRRYFYLLDNLKNSDFVIINKQASEYSDKNFHSYLDFVMNSGSYENIYSKNGIEAYKKNLVTY